MAYEYWKSRHWVRDGASAHHYGYSGYDDYDSGYDYGYRYTPPSVDIHEALAPLITQLREYDFLRLKLEREGGSVRELLTPIVAALDAQFKLAGRYEEKVVQLKNQSALREMIKDIDYDLHLDIRQRSTRIPMPVYYLCRIHRDYWREYSLIVEDLYMSPGYPLTDPRFARFMSEGHEVYFLRLSQFRDGVDGKGNGDGRETSRKTDTFLYDLGRHVFQAAWHEDQRLGVAVAETLGLPQFREAVEILYLCLSGELCELRGAVKEPMLRFFEDVYPSAAIRIFLKKLAGLEGDRLNDMPRRAADLYKRLANAFRGFLATEVVWGPLKLQTPLWKLLYGNVSRSNLVGRALKGDKRMGEATASLEKVSQTVINELLEERP